MHDWAAINGWNRPTTTRTGINTRMGINTPQSLKIRGLTPGQKTRGLTPGPSLERSRTSLENRQVYTPRKGYTDSCTTDYIKYLKSSNKESKAKIKNAMHVTSLQRSKTEIETQELRKEQDIGGILRERSHVYLTNMADLARRETAKQGNKEEMKLGVAMVPKKGHISLQPIFGIEKPHTAVSNTMKHKITAFGDGFSVSAKSTSLIRRKDILEQVKMGTQLLEYAEESRRQTEDMNRQLEDYTMQDLQSEILEITSDLRSPRRTGTDASHSLVTGHGRDSSLLLPSIKNLGPFMVK